MSLYYVEKEDGHDVWLVMIQVEGRRPVWLSMFDTLDAAEKNKTLWQALQSPGRNADGE